MSGVSARAAAGIDPAGMNKAAIPGDDFYAFANGTWLDTTEIPADRGSWGSGSVLGEETNKRLADLLEAAAKNRAASPVGASGRRFLYRLYGRSRGSRRADWRH